MLLVYNYVYDLLQKKHIINIFIKKIYKFRSKNDNFKIYKNFKHI